ncbi:MAG: hypothetical protein EKK69_15050 [Candidatus Competibacteraceae bacterium]|nr:MAG: hypothetical protein EKK69_15050 [Candidatus Competibacteraceae bacterium]
MKEVANLRPYWRYRHSPASVDPRKEHVAWDGLILKHDDPWWTAHTPPNGFGCKCYIETLAERDMKKQGLEVTDKAKIPFKDGGVDKGWDYQPGKTWFPDLNKYDKQTARTMVANNLQDGVFQRWYEFLQSRVAETLKKPEYAALLAQKGKEAKDTLLKKLRADQAHGEAYPVAILDEEVRQLLGVSTQTVLFSDYDAVKQIISREGQAFTAEDYLAVQATVEQARLIVQVGDFKYAFLPQGRKVYVAILQRTEVGHEVYLKSFRFGFGPEEAKALRKRGKVLKDEWEEAKG